MNDCCVRLTLLAQLRLVERFVSLRSQLRPTTYALRPEPIISLAKIGFSHRRKQLRQTLAQGTGASVEVIDAALAKIGVEKTARPQELSIAQWQELCEIFTQSS